eukprot:2477026-Rhodomonas_salina.2
MSASDITSAASGDVPDAALDGAWAGGGGGVPEEEEGAGGSGGSAMETGGRKGGAEARCAASAAGERLARVGTALGKQTPILGAKRADSVVRGS